MMCYMNLPLYDARFLALWIIFFWLAYFNVAVVHFSFQALFIIILWFPL